MKILVVYTSIFQGNTKLIAEKIAETLDADVMEVNPVERLSDNQWYRFMWCCGKIFSRKDVDFKLSPAKLDHNEYDVIFFGTPVWFGTPSKYLYSYLKKFPLKNKKIVLFCVYGGYKTFIFKFFRKLFSENEVLTSKAFHEPVIYGKHKNILLAEKWAEEVYENYIEEK